MAAQKPSLISNKTAVIDKILKLVIIVSSCSYRNYYLSNVNCYYYSPQGATPIYRKMLQCILLNGGIFWVSATHIFFLCWVVQKWVKSNPRLGKTSS